MSGSAMSPRMANTIAVVTSETQLATNSFWRLICGSMRRKHTPIARLGAWTAGPDAGLQHGDGAVRLCRRDGDIEPIEIHDLVPRRREVADEFLLGVIARVDLGERAQLGVRSEQEIDPAGGPLPVARRAAPSFEGLRLGGYPRPLGVH